MKLSHIVAIRNGMIVGVKTQTIDESALEAESKSKDEYKNTLLSINPRISRKSLMSAVKNQYYRHSNTNVSLVYSMLGDT